MHVLCTLISALLAVTARSSISVQDRRIPTEWGKDRITDGTDADPGQFPHQALVVINGRSSCGGSLISKSSVLTAAHCTFRYDTFNIRLGGIHRTEDEDLSWITVSVWAKSHPEYNTTGLENADVGIIFLTEEPPLGWNIMPVELPSFLEVTDSFVGHRALISGWGLTSIMSIPSEVLQWTEVTVIPNSICTMFYEPGVVIGSTLCASDMQTGVCYGDSGSALVLKTTRGYKQIGIDSFGPDLCEKDVPSGYARVTAFLGWITMSNKSRK